MRFPFLVCLAVLPMLAGCKKDPNKLQSTKAEVILDQVLDCWTRGIAIDKASVPGHTIQVTDPDWKAGLKLQSALNSGTTPGDGPDHFRCKVTLSLVGRNGPYQQEAMYSVRLGEKIVVERMPGP